MSVPASLLTKLAPGFSSPGYAVYAKIMFWLVLACACVGMAPPALAETLRTAGTGSAGPLIRLLFAEFSREVPDARLDHAYPPLGSGGSLTALAAGRIDLAVIGRVLKEEERPRFGRSERFAATPLVFASTPGQKAVNFSIEDLVEIYQGRRTQWADGKAIRLVLRPSFDTDTHLVKSLSPAMSQAVERAGQRPGMAVGTDDLDTLELFSVVGSLGPTTLGLLRTTASSLEVHSLQGVKPGIGAMATGQYPLRREFSVVLPRQPTPLARRFA